jgi:hypothetical protein
VSTPIPDEPVPRLPAHEDPAVLSHPAFGPIPPRVTPSTWLAPSRRKSKWENVISQVREANRIGTEAKIAVFTKGGRKGVNRDLRNARTTLQLYLDRNFPLERWQIVQRVQRDKWAEGHLYVIYFGAFTEEEQVVWRKEMADWRRRRQDDILTRAARNEVRRREQAIAQARKNRR